MKLIGFLKEHHPYIEESNEVNESIFINDGDPLYTKVISYLNKGNTLLYYMEIILDSRGNTVGPLSIQTDGYWIWPSYFQYYLKRYPHNDLYNFFINDLEQRQFIFHEINKEKCAELTNFYLQKAGAIKEKKGNSAPLNVKLKPRINKIPPKE